MSIVNLKALCLRASVFHFHLFLKYEIDRQHEAGEGGEMIPFQLHFEGNHREHGKYGERNHLLDDLELHDIKGAAVVAEPQPVGWHLKAIFEKSDRPTEGNDPDEGQCREPAELFTHLQMPVPGESHEDVGENQ